MGVYVRVDSPYYWLLLERKGKPSKKESSRILVNAGSEAANAENRAAAQARYAQRMNEQERQDRYRGNISPEKIGKAGAWCYIYFARQGAAIKIGRAVNIVNRLAQLNVGATEPIEMLAVVPAHQSVETLLHRHFKPMRIRGEWFQPHPELLAAIERVRAGIDVAQVVVELRQQNARKTQAASPIPATV